MTVSQEMQLFVCRIEASQALIADLMVGVSLKK